MFAGLRLLVSQARFVKICCLFISFTNTLFTHVVREIQIFTHEPYRQTMFADMAQLAEQLICNQQVFGSSPNIGFMGGFPSGQRGQTVNLLSTTSMVRIHLHPFTTVISQSMFCVEKEP